MAQGRGRRHEYGSDYHGEPEYRERNDPYMRRQYGGGSQDYGARRAGADEHFGDQMSGFAGGNRSRDRWRQHGSDWSPGGDYGEGGQMSGYASEGDRFSGMDERGMGSRYSGQGGRYGAALAGEMYRERDPYRDYGRARGYGEYRGSSQRWRRGRDEQDYDDTERGFWDRASDEVASWFGDEEAEQRRRMDYRGRGPRGYVRSDERIREDIHDRLTDDWRIDASDIEVEVSNGEVTLSGEVHSRGDKRLAEDIVEDVSGVTHVQNNLRVKKWEQPGKTGVTL